mmetsp:Transcript_13559/g.21149  ORF Transcript_13559/g.21149 Transcript_13559/m.21149 type:complete len:88 (-) Transcript_13559:276-539(-)
MIPLLLFLWICATRMQNDVVVVVSSKLLLESASSKQKSGLFPFKRKKNPLKFADDCIESSAENTSSPPQCQDQYTFSSKTSMKKRRS